MRKALLLELPKMYKDWLDAEKAESGRPIVRIVMDMIDEAMGRKGAVKKKGQGTLPF